MKKRTDLIILSGGILILVSLLVFGILGRMTSVPAVILALGLALVCFSILVNFEAVRRALKSRSLKYGVNAVVITLFIIGILAFVNLIALRHHHRWDLTHGGRFSLSDKTVKILKGLKEDVLISAFFKGEERRLADLLSGYSYRSSRVKYRFIDPDKEPGLTRRYGVTSYGTVVVECGEKEEKLDKAREAELTNAILKVSRKGKKVIYFLTGHGEKNVDATEPEGFNKAKKSIEAENYEVKTLLLAREKEIPADCAVLVVPGPQKPFFPDETQAIGNWLKNGGKALLMLDPPPAAGLEDFMGEWGLTIGNDIVLDASGVGRLFGAGPAMPLVNSYGTHSITKGFNLMTFFPQVRSITPEEEPEPELELTSLVKTSSQSWGETNLKSEKASFDPGKDLKGPVTIGAVITRRAEGEKSSPSGKEVKGGLVVFGDSDFANNAYFGLSGNGDLFMNSLSWLAEEEDLISIRPKASEDRRVNMTGQQARIVFYFSLIILPLLVIGTGGFVWYKRR